MKPTQLKGLQIEPDKDIKYKSTQIADANSRLLAEAATEESRGLEYALLGC